MKSTVQSFLIVTLLSLSNCSRTHIPAAAGAQKQEQLVSKLNDADRNDAGPLTLSKAVSLTLTGSPELQSFSYNKRFGESRLLQASFRPNPELAVVVEDVLGSGVYHDGAQAQSTLLLSQIIELGDKRNARQALANVAQEQINDEYEIKRVEVLAAVTDKYLRTIADKHLRELAGRTEGLARDALTSIKRQVAAGGVSELDETRSTVFLARAQIAHEHAEHELASSQRELASMWGGATVNFDRLEGDLFSVRPLPSLQHLEQRVEQSPEIKRWVTEKRVREAEVVLARSKGVPNLNLGVGHRRFERDNADAWVFQISLPIPLFDRNQAEIQLSQLQQQKVINDTSHAQLRLKTVLFSLYQELQHSLTEIEVMKNEIIPAAERSMTIAQHGFNRGRYSYTELLDAQRTVIEVYREQIEAAYLFHHYTNAIERLLGAPLHVEDEIIVMKDSK